MKLMKTLPACLAMILIAGCIQSLHPLYTPKDIIFDEALVGSWSEEGSQDTWLFKKSGDKSYALTYTEKETPSNFEVRMVQLGKYRFLDFFPKESDIKNDFYKTHLIPAHTFAKLWLEGDSLRFSLLDHDWLKKMIKEKKVKINHEVMNERVVLTASTPQLQKLVVKYAENESAFPQPTALHRNH